MVALPEGHSLAAKSIIYWTDLRNDTALLSQYDPGQELEGLLITEQALAGGHDIDKYPHLSHPATGQPRDCLGAGA